MTRHEDNKDKGWFLIYAAVVINTVMVYGALWWFSRTFG